MFYFNVKQWLTISIDLNWNEILCVKFHILWLLYQKWIIRSSQSINQSIHDLMNEWVNELINKDSIPKLPTFTRQLSQNFPYSRCPLFLPYYRKSNPPKVSHTKCLPCQFCAHYKGRGQSPNTLYWAASLIRIVMRALTFINLAKSLLLTQCQYVKVCRANFN